MDDEFIEKNILRINNCIKEMYQNQQMVVNALQEQNNIINNLQVQIFEKLNNLKYELLDPRNKIELKKYFPQIESQEVLIDKIVNEGYSLARYGDGEFSIMENIARQKFQHLDETLAKRLKEVIIGEQKKLLIGIADNYGNLEKYTEQAAMGIRIYMTEDTRKIHRKYLKEDRIYYDAYVSRPYILYKDKAGAKVRFENLKRIWEKRDVIIIEGAQTRLGVGNDLFDNVKTIRRILAPATSSFDRYDEFISSALKNANEKVLFLLSLGPCAAVAASDLTKNGYQAIDIGHVDLEYEWYLCGKEERTAVKNKYNNEIPGGDIVEENEIPKEYFEQIIANYS